MKKTLSVEEKLFAIVKINEELKKDNYQILHPCLIGISGVGKSSIVKSLFPEVRIVDLSLLLTEEVGGLPRIEKSKGITKYYLPEWFDYDVIFFEEIDKVHYEKLSPLLSLLTNFELHGKKANNKIFIFACQPEWLIENEFNDTLEAFIYRLIFIPCLSIDAFRWSSRDLGIELPDFFREYRNEKEVKLLEFNLPINPRIHNYIGHFIKKGIKLFGIEKAKTLVEEVFWYFKPKTFVHFIFEQIVKGSLFELDEEELLLVLEKLSVIELIDILPKLTHKLSSKTFFDYFTKIYYNSSIDEKKKFFENLVNQIGINGLSNFNNLEVFWNGVASAIALSIATNQNIEKVKEMLKVFKEENLEIYGRIKDLLRKIGKESELEKIISQGA